MKNHLGGRCQVRLPTLEKFSSSPAQLEKKIVIISPAKNRLIQHKTVSWVLIASNSKNQCSYLGAY